LVWLAALRKCHQQAVDLRRGRLALAQASGKFLPVLRVDRKQKQAAEALSQRDLEVGEWLRQHQIRYLVLVEAVAVVGKSTRELLVALEGLFGRQKGSLVV